MNYNVPLLGENCPWYELSKIAPPNVKWCEASTCTWISEPSNTFSNVVFFILAYWIFKQTKHLEDKTLKYFAPAIFFMGLFSLIYHASYNFFAQWFDFVGMFLMMGLFITLNLLRLKVLRKERMFQFYLGFNILFGITVIIFYLAHIPIQSTVALQILFLMLSELKLKSTLQKNVNYKPFIISIILILTAVSFSVMDVTGFFCDPNNHYLQGHSIWHLLSACSIGFVFKFYSQFDYSE